MLPYLGTRSAPPFFRHHCLFFFWTPSPLRIPPGLLNSDLSGGCPFPLSCNSPCCGEIFVPPPSEVSLPGSVFLSLVPGVFSQVPPCEESVLVTLHLPPWFRPFFRRVTESPSSRGPSRLQDVLKRFVSEGPPTASASLLASQGIYPPRIIEGRTVMSLYPNEQRRPPFSPPPRI